MEAMPRKNRDRLMCVIDDFGDLTTTIAAFYDQQLSGLDLESPRGLAGAGATASHARLTAFQRALMDYQAALENLHNNRHGHQQGMLRQEVQRKYRILQQRYQVELKKLARHPGKNCGNAINSAERGIRVAQRRRGRHLYVSNVAEVQKLDRLARKVRYAGHGMVVLDAGIRANHVYGAYQNGRNWMREASIEATGFGLGGAAGLATGKAVVLGLTAVGLGLTPLGWVVIIGASIAAGATVGFYVDNRGKTFAANTWDRY